MDATSTGGRSDRFAPTITFVRDSAPRAPRIDLNRATVAQLLPLPGVDRIRAARILAARRERRFAHVDELLARGVLPASVFRRVRGRVRADFMDEPYLSGIVPSAGKLRAGQPSTLEVRFEDSQPGVRLIQLHVDSVSHSLELSREVTREERRRGVVAFDLPGMAPGVMNVRASVYDGAGSRDRIDGTLPVIPDPGELTVAAYPAGGSLRTAAGAARSTPEGDFICSAAFEFANGTRGERRLRGRVEWSASAGRPYGTLSGSHDWGVEIVVPAEESSSGWFLDIRISRSSTLASALRAGKVVVIRYRFREVNGTSHDATMTWRVVRGPHVNLIYVGSERFPPERRAVVREAMVVVHDIFGQRDFGVGRVGEYGIPERDAGSYLSIKDTGEARALTNDFTVDNDAMDLFIVHNYEGAVLGSSGIDGPCEKNENWWQPKDWTGSVVEQFTPDRAHQAQVIAHELGHYLGLDHSGTRSNLMYYESTPTRTALTSGQADEMRGHCFMRVLG